jgi:hypothetical protein
LRASYGGRAEALRRRATPSAFFTLMPRDILTGLGMAAGAHAAAAEWRDDFVGAEATSGGQGHRRRLTEMRSF